MQIGDKIYGNCLIIIHVDTGGDYAIIVIDELEESWGRMGHVQDCKQHL